MKEPPPATNRPASDRLHPAVYKIMAGLAVWLVMSIWGFSAKRGYADFALTVASAVVLLAVGLPCILWHVGRKRLGTQEISDRPDSFAHWLSGQFETRHGRLKATEAAIEVLLPIAAVAIGMSVFAVLLHFDVGSAA